MTPKATMEMLCARLVLSPVNPRAPLLRSDGHRAPGPAGKKTIMGSSTQP